MEKRAPIKRSRELVPLSHDHHEGLMLCWKINTGLSKNIVPDRITAYVVDFFDNSLATHFEDEERFVFPILERSNIFRKEAETDHMQLREIIERLRDNKQATALSLRVFSDLLTKHIRFEERVLFNMVEKEAGRAKLKSIEDNLARHTKCSIGWHDQFWLKENQ